MEGAFAALVFANWWTLFGGYQPLAGRNLHVAILVMLMSVLFAGQLGRRACI